MIKHKVFWGRVSMDNESETIYWSVFNLPFVLSVGQSVRVLGCSPVEVQSVEIDLEDDGLVDVQLEDWRCGNDQQTWSEVHSLFIDGGWIYLDGSGLGELTMPEVVSNPQPSNVDNG